MIIGYLNISQGNERDIESLKERQKHTILYKEELSRHAGVHYLLRNSCSFQERSSGLSIIAKKAGVAAFIIFAQRYVVQNNITVIIIHNLNNFLYVPFFKLLPGRKIVLQHHGETTYLHKKGFLMRFTDRLTDAYFFHGRGNALPFVDRKCVGKDKVFEIPEGTTDFRLSTRAPSDIKKLIFIGRLDNNKNLITLLKALVPLKEHKFHLNIFFSDSEKLSQLVEFCSANSLATKVNFAGRVPPHQIESALQESDIFISCSKYEAGGYSLIEALACGVYPVVSKIGPFDFILSGLGLARQFSPENVTELTSHLSDVFKLESTGHDRFAIRRFFEARASREAVARAILDVAKNLQKYQ